MSVHERSGIDQRRERIASVQDTVEQMAPGETERTLLVDLAVAFHFRTSLAYFADHSAAEIVQNLRESLSFMQGRADGEIRVRVQASGDGHSILQVTMDDQPFILDTVEEVLRVLEVPLLGFLHPILQVDRNESRRVVAVRPRTASGPHE